MTTAQAKHGCRNCGHARGRHYRYIGCDTPGCSCPVSSSHTPSFRQPIVPRADGLVLRAVYRDGEIGVGKGAGRPVRYQAVNGRYVVLAPQAIGGRWRLREGTRALASCASLREARAMIRDLAEGH